MRVILDDVVNPNEIEALEKRFDDFILREQRFLATFTKDPRLIYLADKNGDRFHLDSRKRVVSIPLAPFVDENYDDNLILWQLYRVIAMYNDWKQYPEYYLTRNQYLKEEIDNMVMHIHGKVKDAQLLDDEAYSTRVLEAYVKRTLINFYREMDRYYSALRVETLAPVYRKDEMKRKISSCSMEEIFAKEKDFEKNKERFSRLFLRELITGDEAIRESENLLPVKLFAKPVFERTLYEVYKDEMKKYILGNVGPMESDRLTAALVQPEFVRLWKEEIDEMDLMPSKGKGERESMENPFRDGDREDASSVDIKEAEKKEAIRYFAEEKDRIKVQNEDVIKGRLKLNEFGVDEDAETTFNLYSRQMDKERKEMSSLWKKLIGEGKKEVNVKQEKQLKGKLNVKILIDSYPEFVEAERRGSYKGVKVFDRYILEPVPGRLPLNIDVSFVLDNSGSMTAEKVDWARKALVVAMESLIDFGDYLQLNGEKLGQNVNVNVETWFFGSNYMRQLSFEDKRNPRKFKANQIMSIVNLKGQGGSTDDGSCIDEIYKALSKSELREIEKGKRCKIVFEITDGASSFPAIAKKAVEKCVDSGIEIYGIEIGRDDSQTRKVFEYIWNDGYDESHGVFVGERIDLLPEQLLRLIEKNMRSIFRR